MQSRKNLSVVSFSALLCLPESHRKSVWLQTKKEVPWVWKRYLGSRKFFDRLWLALSGHNCHVLWSLILHSPDQSETPRSLGSEWFLNTMKAMNLPGAVPFAGARPFSSTLCFLSLSQLSMQWCCVLSHSCWISLKAFYRTPCQEPSSDPCRPQHMDGSSLHDCWSLNWATVPFTKPLWLSCKAFQIFPCPVLYPISYWFACCNPQGPQRVDPTLDMYASVLLSADILPPSKGNKQWGNRNCKQQLSMLTGLSATALWAKLHRPRTPQTTLKGFSGR